MDDRRTRDTLAHLADLFLTGTRPVREAEGADALPPTAAPLWRPTPLDGPAPIRLGPKLPTPVLRSDAQRRPAPPLAFPASGHNLAANPEQAKITEFDHGLKFHHAQPELKPELLEQVGRVLHVQAEDQAARDAEQLAAHFARLEAHGQLTTTPPNEPAPAAPVTQATWPDEDAVDPPDESALPLDFDLGTNGRRLIGISPSPETAEVEAVLLTNLPGLSGPWLTQYAQQRAEAEGPLLIAHLDEDVLDLELIEPLTASAQPEAATTAQQAVRVPPVRRTDLESGIALMRSLITAPQQPVRRVLVRLEAVASAALIDRLDGLPQMTLLCGADDAALAASEQLLRQLTEQHAALHEKTVGVAILGSPEARAAEAAEKLRSLTEPLLNKPLVLRGSQQRMAPAGVRQLGQFQGLEAGWPVLASFLHSLAGENAQTPTVRRQRRMSDPVPELRHVVPGDRERVRQALDAHGTSNATQDAEASASIAEALAELASQQPRPVPSQEPSIPQAVDPDTIHPTESATAPAAVFTGGSAPLSASTPADEKAAVATAPLPQREEAESAITSPAETVSLARLLIASPQHEDRFAESLVLEARCPRHPETELLLDRTGRLHLFARVCEGQPPREALLSLLEAKHWAGENAALLRLTQPQARFNPVIPPALHLLTCQPAPALAAAAQTGDLFHIHLLQQIHIGQQSTWFCAPLT